MKSADREHYGLAVYCARRFQGRGVDMEELIAESEAALLWAASRFDESRGVRFSTYAIPVVLGALRQLCRQAAPMHVPRTDRQMLRSAQLIRERILMEEGREPDVRRIAREMDTDEERLAEMLAASERMKLSSGTLDASCVPEDSFEDRVLLRDALQSLPSPCAQAVWLGVGLGLGQTEIARRLGVSQPQVSRWQKRGVELLRQALREL
ncbi:MAG: sigma-70 family RNA polymerase sigma factor [Clostridia bacterium]|nr:sigma-70 family RNA polymerase sigma factor [Clostridia bacterium]